MIGLRSLQAQTIVNIPGWEPYSFRCVGEGSSGGVLMMGGVTPLITRGKNKGRRNYRKIDNTTVREVFVKDSDYHAFCEQWSKDTGNCIKCEGECQVFASWHHIDGTTYAPCKSCNATGKV